MLSTKSKFSIFLLFSLLILPLRALVVEASISSCTATVSPTSIPHQKIGSSVSIINKDLIFSVNNTSGSSIVWVKLTAPSSEFGVNGGSSSGWGTTNNSQSVTFTSGSIAAGASADFVVNVTPGTSDVAAAAWTVEVSDDSGGASPTTCGGSTSVEISGLGPDTDAPNFTSLIVSDVTSGSVKMTWDTDESSNSSVDFGTTTDYGTNKSDGSMVTSHSLTLDGLSANTTYYYNAHSTDSSGNVGESGNNAFATAAQGTTGTTVVGTVKTETKTVTKEKILKDTTAPSVYLTTNFDKPYEKSPTLSGTATDGGGVSRVEYSLDSGDNWLPVDTLKGQFSKSASFDFTLVNLDDGDYKIRVRAYDPTGNVGISKIYTMVIDRLPPLVGGSLFSIGPLVLEPDDNGVISTLWGLDQKITLSSVGGATFTDLYFGSQKFGLAKNVDNGLWTGNLKFAGSGVFSLIAKSTDGANNKTERKLNSVAVLENGKVTSLGKPVSGATVTLYYFEPTSSKFVVWDGTPFVQENPQKTKDDGSYRFFLPAGKYYFEISADNLKTAKSRIFNLDKNTPINADFPLEASFGFSIGPIHFRLPGFFAESLEVKINAPDLSGISFGTNINGTELPYLALGSESGAVSTSSFRGKITVFAILSTWSPQTPAQMEELEKLAKTNKGINVVAVMSQETASKAVIFKKKGGYSVQILADSDGLLVEPINLTSFPTIVLMDKKSVVLGVSQKMQTKDEILKNIIY